MLFPLLATVMDRSRIPVFSKTRGAKVETRDIRVIDGLLISVHIWFFVIKENTPFRKCRWTFGLFYIDYVYRQKIPCAVGWWSWTNREKMTREDELGSKSAASTFMGGYAISIKVGYPWVLFAFSICSSKYRIIICVRTSVLIYVITQHFVTCPIARRCVMR